MQRTILSERCNYFKKPSLHFIKRSWKVLALSQVVKKAKKPGYLLKVPLNISSIVGNLENQKCCFLTSNPSLLKFILRH